MAPVIEMSTADYFYLDKTAAALQAADLLTEPTNMEDHGHLVELYIELSKPLGLASRLLADDPSLGKDHINYGISAAILYKVVIKISTTNSYPTFRQQWIAFVIAPSVVWQSYQHQTEAKQHWRSNLAE